jgi:hypothetical protein
MIGQVGRAFALALWKGTLLSLPPCRRPRRCDREKSFILMTDAEAEIMACPTVIVLVVGRLILTSVKYICTDKLKLSRSTVYRRYENGVSNQVLSTVRVHFPVQQRIADMRCVVSQLLP